MAKLGGESTELLQISGDERARVARTALLFSRRRSRALPADHAAHLRRAELPAGAALPSRTRPAEARPYPAPHSARTADESATRRPACEQRRQSLAPQHTSRASCFQYLRCVRDLLRAIPRRNPRHRAASEAAKQHVADPSPPRLLHSPRFLPSSRILAASPALPVPQRANRRQQPSRWKSPLLSLALPSRSMSHPHHQTSTKSRISSTSHLTSRFAAMSPRKQNASPRISKRRSPPTIYPSRRHLENLRA